jgi:acetyl esterase/lipase
MLRHQVKNAARCVLTVAILTVLTACQAIELLAANVPASFGSYKAHRDLKYGSQDRQELDVYVPTDTKESRAVVVFVHGGGWTSGSKGEYRFVAEALTSRGIIAVLPSYRLYPQVKFPAFVDDVAQAVAWAHQHAAEYGGDADRIYLMGHSAGAQITALIAFDAEYLQRAGGERAWIKGFIGLAGPYDFLPFKDDYQKELFGPEPEYPRSQAVNYVDAQAPPALLIHGEADTKVWPSNSVSLAKQMRAHHVSVVEHYYPDMTHSDVLAALSVYYRGRRPILDEIDKFVNSENAAVHTAFRSAK